MIGVNVYGGFVGTESNLVDRNPAVNITILSGDLSDDDDNTNIVSNEPTRADNSYHVVTGANDATLDGFTVTAGNADVSHYPDINGGGMYNDNGSPTLTNVTFSANSAYSQGGGMFNGNGSSPTLTNVTFSGNSAGGASSAGYGGGMGMDESGCNPTLTNVTFSGNSAGYGSGMYNWTNSSPTLTNVTFSGNSAAHNGGGMVNYGSNPTLTNVILWGNSGGQIYNSGGTTAVISYSVVQGGCPVGSTCANIITTNPMLGALANNGGSTQTFALLTGSSAIEAGNDAVCAAAPVNNQSQNGLTRPQGVHCDIGSFEALDTIAPDTQINSHPASLTPILTANFTFSTVDSADITATFECSLDASAYAACVSPQNYNLAVGVHTFAVRAMDAAANIDSTPASYTWVIGKEHALNGGFEKYPKVIAKIPTSWKAVKFGLTDGKNTTHKAGKFSVQIIGDGVQKTLTQKITASGVLGTPVSFSFYVKGKAVPKLGNCQAVVTFFNGGTKVGTAKIFKCPSKSLTFTWAQVKSVGFTAPGTFDKITIVFTVKKSAGTLWFDGVSLVK